ncbi:MAG: GNAT family N-acetyltransferase [Betaproteobacteria bacterium]
MSSAAATFRAFAARLEEIDEKLIQAWQSLEQRAISANAYLSPHFALPALRNMDTDKTTMVVCVERQTGSDTTLAGVGIFERCAASREFPLPHLASYRSRHSFLSGLLVDREDTAAVMGAFFDFLTRPGADWHGVLFTDRIAEGPLAIAMEQAARERGFEWNENYRTQRAVLLPATAGENYLEVQLPAARRKDLRRRMRRLQDLGQVAWRARVGADVTADCVDRFVELEHMGWKESSGTSLRANPTDEIFFREMISSFRSNDKLFFTELVVNDKVVASTSNLVSGNAGFAFKLCWHPDYAKSAPGVLNEVELIRNAPELCRGLDYIDSGASEGSFMDELWSGRQQLTSGNFALTTVGKQAQRAVRQIRKLKNWLAVQACLAWTLIEPVVSSCAVACI